MEIERGRSGKMSHVDNGVTKWIEGAVICVIDGNQSEYDSGQETYEKHAKQFGVEPNIFERSMNL